jgi:hypothetical protein
LRRNGRGRAANRARVLEGPSCHQLAITRREEHRVGRVVDLEAQRVEQLAVELAPVLPERGVVVANIADLENVDRWRRAARRAGRLLGWSVRTGVTSDGARVWAASDDWPGPARRGTPDRRAGL